MTFKYRLFRFSMRDVLGDAVNLSARVVEVAKPDEVAVSRDTKELVRSDPAFGFEARGSTASRVGEVPVQVFRLVNSPLADDMAFGQNSRVLRLVIALFVVGALGGLLHFRQVYLDKAAGSPAEHASQHSLPPMKVLSLDPTSTGQRPSIPSTALPETPLKRSVVNPPIAGPRGGLPQASFSGGHVMPELPVDVLMETADQAYWSKDYRRSLEYYTMASIGDPASSAAWQGKAFCLLSLDLGKRVDISPWAKAEDFERTTPHEGQELTKAYDFAKRALAAARNDKERLRAHVALGIIALAMGCDCDHGGPGGMHSMPCCGGRVAPAYEFADALRADKQFLGAQPHLSLQDFNERMFYAGLAREGLLMIANRGNNRWGLGDLLKELGLE